MSAPFHIDVGRDVLPMLRLVQSAVCMSRMLGEVHHFRAIDPKVHKALMGIPTSIDADISDEVSEVLETVISMLTVIEDSKGGAA